MRSTFVSVVLTTVGLTFAQTQYSIDPNSVLPSTRQTWCDNQKSSCPLLCTQTGTNSQATTSNDCNATTLAYKCVCSNGISPNTSEYSLTIPYFICTETNNQCVNKCSGNDHSCQDACRAQHPCGASSPKLYNTSTMSTMAATKTGNVAQSTNMDAVYTTYGGAAATGSAAAGSGAPTVFSIGQSFGMLIVISGLFAGFALII